MAQKLTRINATTYGVDYGRARVEIGDADSDKFMPCCKMYNFEDETSLKVSYSDRPYSLLSDTPNAEEVDKIILTEAEVYALYEVGVWYSAGDKIDYYGNLFEVVQAHTSQTDWPPPEVPALYKTSTPQGVIGAWKQPLGSHDAYRIDTRVSHGGKIWVTTIDYNVWEPSVYGWSETTGTVDVECYSVTTEQGAPGFEFEIILRGRPASNVVEMALETEGLNFYYQPALTQEEINEGVIRPENVVGSYAVYHATCGQVHKGQATAEKYKTGKAFHIYRPKVVDANEDWVWGELNISGSTLSITIDQAWMDNAVYPVKVDPTFGYASAASAGNYSMATQIAGSWSACPENGTAQSISWHGSGTSSGHSVLLALYTYTGVLANDTYIGKTEIKTIYDGAEWHTHALATPYEFASTDTLWFMLSASANTSIYRDVGPNKSGNKNYNYDGNFPSTLFGGSTWEVIFDIYVTYDTPASLTAQQVGANIVLDWGD